MCTAVDKLLNPRVHIPVADRAVPVGRWLDNELSAAFVEAAKCSPAHDINFEIVLGTAARRYLPGR